MNIRVLGSVSPCCTLNENCPGYYVSIKNEKFLLDCGSGISRHLKFPDDIINLNIVITHLHRDHYLDIYNILYAAKQFRRDGSFVGKINVYVPATPTTIVNDLINEGEDVLNIVVYDESLKFGRNNIEVSFFKTKHTLSLLSYAIKIKYDNKSIIYTGDTSSLSIESLVDFSKDSSLIICDSTFLDSKGQSNSKYHMTAKEAALLAKKSVTKMLLLTHFSSFDYQPSEALLEARKEFLNSFIAQTGLEINI